MWECERDYRGFEREGMRRKTARRVIPVEVGINALPSVAHRDSRNDEVANPPGRYSELLRRIPAPVRLRCA